MQMVDIDNIPFEEAKDRSPVYFVIKGIDKIKKRNCSHKFKLEKGLNISNIE